MEGSSPTLPFRLPSTPPPETAPVPLEAWFDEADEAAYILFDKELENPGVFDASTFTIHRSDRRYETGDVSPVDATILKITGADAVEEEGAEVIDYDAALGTLIGTNGLPVASFAGFPCPTQT